MIQVRAKVTRNRFRTLSAQARKGAATLNVRTATEAAKIARQLVPVDTGALRESISVEANTRTGSATLTAGNNEVTYAAVIEYGSPANNQAAQPFITPAIESVRKTARRRAQSIRFYR